MEGWAVAGALGGGLGACGGSAAELGAAGDLVAVAGLKTPRALVVEGSAGADAETASEGPTVSTTFASLEPLGAVEARCGAAEVASLAVPVACPSPPDRDQGRTTPTIATIAAIATTGSASQAARLVGCAAWGIVSADAAMVDV